MICPKILLRTQPVTKFTLLELAPAKHIIIKVYNCAGGNYQVSFLRWPSAGPSIWRTQLERDNDLWTSLWDYLEGAKFLILEFLTSKMASVRVIIKTKKLPGILRLPLMIQLMSYDFLFGRQNICHLPCPRPPKRQLKGLWGQNLAPFLALYSSLIFISVSIIFKSNFLSGNKNVIFISALCLPGCQ